MIRHVPVRVEDDVVHHACNERVGSSGLPTTILIESTGWPLSNMVSTTAESTSTKRPVAGSERTRSRFARQPRGSGVKLPVLLAPVAPGLPSDEPTGPSTRPSFPGRMSTGRALQPARSTSACARILALATRWASSSFRSRAGRTSTSTILRNGNISRASNAIREQRCGLDDARRLGRWLLGSDPVAPSDEGRSRCSYPRACRST